MVVFPGPGIYRISLKDHPYLHVIREQKHLGLRYLALGEYIQQDWIFRRVGPAGEQRYLIKQKGEVMAAVSLSPPEETEDDEDDEDTEDAEAPPEGYANAFISSIYDNSSHWTVVPLENYFLLRNVEYDTFYMFAGENPIDVPPGIQNNIRGNPVGAGGVAGLSAQFRWNISRWVPGPGLQRITLGINPDFDLVEAGADVFIRPAGPHQNWRIIPVEEGAQRYFIERKETARVICLDPDLDVAQGGWASVILQNRALNNTERQHWTIVILEDLFLLRNVAHPTLYMAAEQYPLDHPETLEFKVGVRTIPDNDHLRSPSECRWDISPWIPRYGSHRISFGNDPSFDWIHTNDNEVIKLGIGPLRRWTMKPASDNVQKTQKYRIQPTGSDTVLTTLDPPGDDVAIVRLVNVANNSPDLGPSYDERPHHWRIVSFGDKFLIRNAAYPKFYLAKVDPSGHQPIVGGRPIPNDRRNDPPAEFKWDIEILPP